MEKAPVETLLHQYRESVAQVAAPVEDQLRWMHAHRFPSDEIMQDLAMVVFTHQPRLVRAGLLSSDAVTAVAEVLAQFESWSDV